VNRSKSCASTTLSTFGGLTAELLELRLGGVDQHLAGVAQLDDHQVAQVLEELEGQGEEILARREDLVEAAQGEGRIAGEHGLDEAGDGEDARDPEHDADLVGADLPGVAGERDDLVEQGQRVAHRPVASARDGVEAGLLDLHALAGRIHCRCPTSWALDSRRKSKRDTRDRIVAGSSWTSVVAKMKVTCSGGSSSVLSRALNAEPVSMWTSSMM
jgi:hypothetical protein